MAGYSTNIRCIGILTSGGDCPGLNAAIRSITKSAIRQYGIKVLGIRDGFRGLVENRSIPLFDETVSGILTDGGTFLGTSRDKPRKMMLGNKKMDLTDVAIKNIRQMQIDCLMCLGGGGTQKNAYHLATVGGIPVITLPKTIDNDVAITDTSFGFDTALQTATEAIDRLHTTATSHQRIIICEVMGHNAGWLALGAGVAGGADIILIPEISYDINHIAEFISERRRNGKRFSIICMAEGAVSSEGLQSTRHSANGTTSRKQSDPVKNCAENTDGYIREPQVNRLARHLQDITGIETRTTSLGHILRGGVPSAKDRILCTQLGTAAVEACINGKFNVMIAVKGEKYIPVDLADVAGKKKLVEHNHPLIKSASKIGTSFGIPFK